MGLTGGPFIVLLGVLAIAAFVACVRLLPRVRGGGPRPVLARTGLITATQFMMVFAVLAAVNSSFGFFSSWSDAMGTDKSRVHVEDGGASGRLPAAASVPSLTPTYDSLSRSTSSRDGRLESVVIHGARSGLTTRAYVYLPPQYAQPAYRHRRLPVVLVLTADVRALMTRLNLPAVATGQIAAGEVRPTVYVMVDPPAACVDVPGGKQGAMFLSQDVPTAVITTYRVAQDGPGWGVLGDSSGGYCAAKLSLEHSDRFAAGASAALSYTAPPGNLHGGSTAVRDENDLLWRLQHRPSPPGNLLVVTAGGNAAQARRLSALMRPPMRGDVLTVSGDGTLPTWQRDLPAVLKWLGARLSPEN